MKYFSLLIATTLKIAMVAARRISSSGLVVGGGGVWRNNPFFSHTIPVFDE